MSFFLYSDLFNFLGVFKVDIHFGHVSMYQTPKPISWIIYIYIIYIRFGPKLYRQIVGIPMGTKCAPLVADLFLCYCEEISWILLTMAFKLMVSRLLIRLLGVCQHHRCRSPLYRFTPFYCKWICFFYDLW